LEASSVTPTSATIKQVPPSVLSVDSETPTTEQLEQKEETFGFLQDPSDLEESVVESSIVQLSPDQQSDILDRFFSRQIAEGRRS